MTGGVLIIELVGGGFENKGDELMLRAVVGRIGRTLPDVQFASAPWTASYEDRSRCGFYQKLDNRTAGRIGVLIDLLMHRGYRRRYGVVTDAELSAVVDLSGFGYGDAWGPNAPERVTKHVRRLKKAGKKYIMLPQAFGPFTSEPIRRAFREVARSADLIYARDRLSLGYIREFCEPDQVVKLAPDITTDVPGVVPGNHAPGPGQVLVIPNAQMIRQSSQELRRRYVPFMANVIEEAAARGYRPAVFLHTRTYDDELARAIVAAYDHSIEMIREDDPFRSKGIIGQASLVVGSRYHSIVSALSQGVPALATSWSHKYPMLLEDYACPDGLLDPRATREELARKFDAVLNEPDRSALIDRIRRAGEKQRRALEAMWEEVTARLREEVKPAIGNAGRS